MKKKNESKQKNISRISKKDVKIQERMGSSNIKKKSFEEMELGIYEMRESDINIILEYQERLPILQQDNDNWIDARDLWEQLGVGRDYSDWIKQQITDIDLEKDCDYRFTPSKGKTSIIGGRPNDEYLLKVSTAKEVAMIAGAKGGRTSKQLKETSRIARKYFIAIESAYNLRKEWNYDRADTLVEFTGLQYAFMKYRPQLLKTLPSWANGNIQIAEFWSINDIIIGMTSKQYRNLMGLKSSEPIRNAFTEEQLEYLAELERFDADLISVLHIFDFEKRHRLLIEKFKGITV